MRILVTDGMDKTALAQLKANGHEVVERFYAPEELGAALGRGSCAMAAVTDLGFALALAEKLAARDPARYGEAVERLRLKAERAAQRRQAPRKRPGRKKK